MMMTIFRSDIIKAIIYSLAGAFIMGVGIAMATYDKLLLAVIIEIIGSGIFWVHALYLVAEMKYKGEEYDD